VQTFTIGTTRGGLLGRLGRNRLVRASDRIEAIATLVLFLLAVAIISVVAAAVMSTHRHQATMYAREADGVHQMTARVTASSPASSLYGAKDVWVAQIAWETEGSPRVGSITWPSHVKVGDQVPIWVDGMGKLRRAPVSTDQAVMDGVVVALLSWSALMGVAAGGRWLLTWRLDRHRNAQWEKELHELVDGRGGRADHKP